MSCALYFSRLPFPLLTGLRPSTLPPISSTVSPPRRLPTPPLTSLSSASIPLTTIFVSSGVLAIPISLPLLLISSPLTPLAVSSLVTLPIIRDIGVLTSPPTESSSLVTSVLMSRTSLFPPPYYLSHRSRRVPQPQPCVPHNRASLPHRFVCFTASRGPSCAARPRTATCSLDALCAALPRTTTCDLGAPGVASCDPACAALSRTATCGLDVPRVASRGPVCTALPAQPRAASTSPPSPAQPSVAPAPSAPSLLAPPSRYAHPDIPVPWSTRYPGSFSHRGPDLSPRRRPL
jgi:hypothetical protein